MIDSLLADTLRFVQENSTTTTCWTVKPSEMHLKQTNVPKKETPVSHQKTPETFIKIPEKKQPPKPLLKTSPIEPEILKETPKTPIQNTPLGVDSLSLAVKKLFPHFTTHKELPKPQTMDPSHKKALLAEVVLFSFREGKESDLFLQNVQQAITSHFTLAAVLDVGKWELSQGDFDSFFSQMNAKIIIASPSLYKKPSLLPFFKEIPASSERFLGSSRLLLLNPFENYFNNPLQKKDLWNTLCATLKNNLSMSASSLTKP